MNVPCNVPPWGYSMMMMMMMMSVRVPSSRGVWGHAPSGKFITWIFERCMLAGHEAVNLVEMCAASG